MSGETMTVVVPSALVGQLRDRAQQRRHSVEEELVEVLAATFAADSEEKHSHSTDDVASDFASVQAELALLADDTLWQIAQTSHPSPVAAAYLEDLNFKRQREGLTAEEEHVAAVLMQQAGRQMLRRSEALALLKERGHDIAPLLEPVTR
jgi:hypothetical protein